MKPKPPPKVPSPTSITTTLTHPPPSQPRSLADLPPRVVVQTLALALKGPDAARPLELMLLSKQIHAHAEEAVFGEIELEDDDAVLVGAEGGEGILGRIWNDERVAAKVHRLTIVESTISDDQVSDPL